MQWATPTQKEEIMNLRDGDTVQSNSSDGNYQSLDKFANNLADGAIRAIHWTKQAINAPLKQLVSTN